MESASLRGAILKVDTPDRIRKRLDHLTDAADTGERSGAKSRGAETEAEDAVIRLSRERAVGDVDLMAGIATS